MGIVWIIITALFLSVTLCFFGTNPAIAALGLVGTCLSHRLITDEAYEVVTFIAGWAVTAGLIYLAATAILGA